MTKRADKLQPAQGSQVSHQASHQVHQWVSQWGQTFWLGTEPKRLTPLAHPEPKRLTPLAHLTPVAQQRRRGCR